MNLKQALKGRLTKKELEIVRRSFDIIGDIAVIEIPRQLVKKQKIIAQTLLKTHKNIKVVAKKSGGHLGVYRVQKLVILAGERRKTTEHKESGLRMKLDVEKCYFSPRLGTDRLRIAKQVKKEDVLVMFSGVAPYVLVIAKHSKTKKVIGVEINPTAHKYALENIKLNKLGAKAEVFKGNVKTVVPKLKQKFDRILMPLPKTADKFLSLALSVAKKGSVIHFYDFQPEKSFAKASEKVKKACKKAKRKCKVLRIVACGQAKAREYRVCVDVKILD